jgi:NAD(P)-dependent dehydrogenase (short-subunit alcohol dehydrogenase family)
VRQRPSAEPLLRDIAPDLYQRLMTTNVDGVVFGIQAVILGMVAKGGGAIVVTSSLAGIVPFADEPLYAASKHALIGLVRSLAPQLQPKGMTINAMCFLGNRARAAELRLMDPAEVADGVITCFTGQETGKTYTVRGGRGRQEHEFAGL